MSLVDQYRGSNGNTSVTGPNITVMGRNNSTLTTYTNMSEIRNLTYFGGTAYGTATTVDISSSSANDAAAGTGAQKVRIIGLDATGNFQTEEIVPTGVVTTYATGVKTWSRVFAAEVSQAGTGFVNAGTIYVIKSLSSAAAVAGVPPTLTSAWVMIPVGLGGCGNGLYTVPPGKTAKLISLYGSVRTQVTDIAIFSQKTVAGLAGTNPINYEFAVTFAATSPAAMLDLPSCTFPEWTDINLRCISGTGAGVALGTMVLKLGTV